MCKKCKEAGGGKRRTIRQLMGSRKATRAVLDFIVATQTGRRVKKHEQEKERQEIERNKAWCLDVDRLEGDEEVDVERERGIGREEGEIKRVTSYEKSHRK